MASKTAMAADVRHAQCIPHRTRFSSVMGGKFERIKLDAISRRIFGLHADKMPEAITFNHWSPDPWKVMSTGGAVLCTISAINVTVISGQSPSGNSTMLWNMSVNVQSDGWTANHSFAPYDLIFTGPSGQLVAQFQSFGTPYLPFVVACHENSTQFRTANFDFDVFSLISGAHLSMPNATFWKCLDHNPQRPSPAGAGLFHLAIARPRRMWLIRVRNSRASRQRCTRLHFPERKLVDCSILGLPVWRGIESVGQLPVEFGGHHSR